MGYTPMVKQYLAIKEQHKDAILFFRLGDFYEMFFDDALRASQILEIALTARDGGKGKIPMCGIPYHAYEAYVAKLLLKGYRVAICEQMEDPAAAKGIVHREVTRIITPGTVIDEKVLGNKRNNYLIAISIQKSSWGLAYVDVSTGEFKVTQSSEDNASLLQEINRLRPAECLITENLRNDQRLISCLKQLNCSISWRPAEHFHLEQALGLLSTQINHFDEIKKDLAEWPLAVTAVYLILIFLQETQKQRLGHLTRLEIYQPNHFMLLDTATSRNLELIDNLHTQSVRGSLLGVLDETVTAMGARKLKQWIEMPLLNLDFINQRLEVIEELVCQAAMREGLRMAIKGIYDLERLLGRISYGTANARDLLALKKSIKRLPQVALVLGKAQSKKLQTLLGQLDILDDLFNLIDKSIVEEPPTSLREGNLIKDGFHPEADQLKEASRDGKRWLTELEAKERERTGIRSLKVGFNKVFGYFLEVTRSNLNLVPPDYHRKQTLANAERFITSELKDKETLILGAEERLNTLEYHLFQEIRLQVEGTASRIQRTASIIAEVDVFLSLASVAIKNNYCKPELQDNVKLEILEARHPVVEELSEGRFVANDYYLDPPRQTLNIITGPNMAGKSTYIRTAALIAIMAQIGSFVPASKAILGIVDRVFARVGASDDLSTGRSTFMVEMNEVANILHNASSKSLIILDEVGRGTSTYDGISIAWAVSEYITEKLKARTLFATHYHELIELQQKRRSINNFSMAVKEEQGEITFLRRIVPGGADRSYGIHVAELAGLPKEVIHEAYSILTSLERIKGHLDVKKNHTLHQETSCAKAAGISLPSVGSFFERLLKLDLDQISPIKAWHLLTSFQSEGHDLWKGLQKETNEPNN